MSERLLDQRWPWLLLAGLISLAFLSTFVQIGPSDDFDRRPLGDVEDIEGLRERDDLNVLFILIDTMRAERLGSYGYSRDTSPRIDRLAAEGVRFERHLAQSSWTKTSMASLWTSLYPNRTGIIGFDDVLPEEARMPSEIFQDAGFRTAGIYRNGWVAPAFGFSQGFEVYQKSLGFGLPAGVVRENPTISERSTDEAAIRAAMEFLRLRKDDRWFLYLHLMDLHEYVYDQNSARFGSTYSDIYDNSIRWTDETVGLFLDRLGDMGLLEKTLIVLTSDHGEAFGERGFEGHAQQVFRETTEVPFVLSFPFRLKKGVALESRTRNVDLWPTVFDLLGLDLGLDEVSNADGRSQRDAILALARGEAPPERTSEDDMGFAYLNQNWAKPGLDPQSTLAVTSGPLRFVRSNAGESQVEMLFDAAGDRSERRNQIEERNEDRERLKAAADDFLETTPDWAIERRDLTELERGQLRALGYAIP